MSHGNLGRKRVFKPTSPTDEERAEYAPELKFLEEHRPQTIEDCEELEGPCPFVGCRHHLYLDIQPSGNIRFNFPDLEVDEIPETCSLRIARAGGVLLDKVGEVMNMTRQGASILEAKVLEKFSAEAEHLRPAYEESMASKPGDSLTGYPDWHIEDAVKMSETAVKNAPRADTKFNRGYY